MTPEEEQTKNEALCRMLGHHVLPYDNSKGDYKYCTRCGGAVLFTIGIDLACPTK